MVKRATLLIALAACASSDLDPLIARTIVGPAAGRPLHTIVALSPTCGTFGVSVTPGGSGGTEVRDAECKPELLGGIAEHVRSRFDFLGYKVIDAERVNAVTATRHEVIDRREAETRFRKAYENSSESSRTEVVGATFDDATPVEQAQILHELGADALLTTRIWVGAAIGTSSHRNVVVQLRLTSAADRRMIWARRCELQVGGLLVTDTIAIENAAHCADQELPRP